MYRQNVDTRRIIISEINIEEENDKRNSRNKKDFIYSSPIVNLKKGRKKKNKGSKRKSRSNSKFRSIQTQAEDPTSNYTKFIFIGIEQRENHSIFDNSGIIDLKNLKYSDSYAKLILELRDKIINGLDEDVYNLKTFDEITKKIETQCWVLKDLFYTSNKELRKTLQQAVDEDYEKEVNELEVLDAYRSTKDMASVYQREIKWLKSQKAKLTTDYSKLSDKYKDLKRTVKVNNLSWEKLKKENDNLLGVIKNIQTEMLEDQVPQLQSPKVNFEEVKEEPKSGLDEMISKINNLIIEDSSDASASKNSEQYKTEIKSLNQVIDTLLIKLQTPKKEIDFSE